MAVSVMVPVLTMRNRDGRMDRGASAAYARRAAETWLDGFLVSGSIGLGSALSAAERRETLEVWLDHVPVWRLLACAWEAGEADEIRQLGVRPVAVLRGAEDDNAVLELLRSLPPESYLYSHPQYTSAVLSPVVVEKARAEGVLVAGAKVSKVELDEVRALRSAAGAEFELFDGRCRDVRASVEAGATGVVAVPLATLPQDLPPREDVATLQAVIDRTQAVVDSEPDVIGQATALRKMLIESL